MQALDVGEEDHGVFESGDSLGGWVAGGRGYAKGDVVYSKV